jgi:hypothetical protein
MSRVRESIAWAAVLVGAVAGLLAPAVWNGFPFVFFDSKAYIEEALGGGFLADRSVFYAWFLKASGVSVSLWFPVIAQAALAVVVIAVVARRVVTDLRPGAFAIIAAVLCVFTALPWTAGQIMPDALTGVLVLSLYAVAFPGPRMRWFTRVGLLVIAVMATTVHASHVGITAGLAAVVFVAAQLHARRAFVMPAPAWRPPAAVAVLSIVLLVASNYAHTGQVFINRTGPSFVLGNLMERGLIKPVLDEQCGVKHYALCAYKDNLPKTADEWLWAAESPFKRFEGWNAYAPEAERLILESFKRDPAANIAAAIAAAARQFARVATGDGFEPMGDELVPAIAAVSPGSVTAYRIARQQGTIDFSLIGPLHTAVAAMSLLGITGALFAAVAAHPRGFRWPALPVFVVFALLGNAFICGAFSGVHGRYQSRLAWVGVFAACLMVASKVRRLHQSRLRPGPMRHNDSGPLPEGAQTGRTRA